MLANGKHKNVVFKLLKFNEDEEKKDLERTGVSKRTLRPNYSIISLSQVTEESLEVWRKLPAVIRQDPSLASFRQEHERLHGEFLIFYLFFFCLMVRI